MRLFTLFLGAITLLFAQSSFAFLFFSPSYDITPDKALNITKANLSGNTNNLDANVLQYALKAYSCARKKGLDNKQVLTIIDYSKPSTQQRMWVIDLKHLRVKYAELVAHGEKSGDMVAKYFSNSFESHQSSLGLFVTGDTYNMKNNGLALRLVGLEPGVNDNAMKRGIVIHGADYVNPNRVIRQGQLGRSFGCPAVPKNMISPTVNTIKEGTLVFAYAPQSAWLKHSPYLHC